MAYTVTGPKISGNVDARFYWNRPANSTLPRRWYSNVGEAIDNRPKDSTVLGASVYYRDANRRLIGNSYFHTKALLSHQKLEAPIQRVYNPHPSGKLTIYGYNIKPVIAASLNSANVSIMHTSLIQPVLNITIFIYPLHRNLFQSQGTNLMARCRQSQSRYWRSRYWWECS